MKYNPSRAYAPIRELPIMKINYNNPNNWQIIGINRYYCGLLKIIAIICLKFIIQLILIIVLLSIVATYCHYCNYWDFMFRS